MRDFSASRLLSTTVFVRSLAVLIAVCASDPRSAFAQQDAMPVASPVAPAAAAHFLDQAAFGPSPADVAAIQARGQQQWLQEQFQVPESPIPDGLTTSQVRAQVFRNMATGADQLRQRVVFALSQVFVVSANKVGLGSELTPWMRLLSRNAFGNYRTLLREVTLNPTMGKYLDLAYSRKATRTTSINENYAREMLQLFSVGTWQLNQDGTLRLNAAGQPIPAYTQDTIREHARALTGWTFPTAPGAAPGSTNPQYFEGEMEPRPANHDNGAKQLINGFTLPAGQSPVADLEVVVDAAFTHPNVPPFIATRLIRSLVKSNPSPAFIQRVANVFADNGQGVRGDLRAVVTAILLDPEALNFSGRAEGRLRDPVLHVIGLGRALGAQFLDVGGFMYVFSNLSELVLTPTTVFSFYSPLSLLPGRQDLFGPEFQIYPPALAIQRANFIYGLLTNQFRSSFTVDLTPFTAVAANDAALVERVNQTLMYGTMSPELRNIIALATRAVPANQLNPRAQGALYLAAISSEYSVYSNTGEGAPGPPVGSLSAPENLVGVANGSTLTLTWRNSSAAGVPTSMLLDVTGAVSLSVPLPLTETFSYTGVPNGTYTFSVRAVSGAGTSLPSNAVTLTFPGSGSGCAGVPQAPTALVVTRNGNIVSLSWQPPAGGPPASSYIVDVGGTVSASLPTTSLALSGAAPSGMYAITVRAVNACGAGPASASQTIAVP